MDLSLPIMSGHDAGAMIMAQDRGDNIMLIALTGWCRPDDQMAGRFRRRDAH